jgi:hypothetical protein
MRRVNWAIEKDRRFETGGRDATGETGSRVQGRVRQVVEMRRGRHYERNLGCVSAVYGDGMRTVRKTVMRLVRWMGEMRRITFSCPLV